MISLLACIFIPHSLHTSIIALPHLPLRHFKQRSLSGILQKKFRKKSNEKSYNNNHWVANQCMALTLPTHFQHVHLSQPKYTYCICCIYLLRTFEFSFLCISIYYEIRMRSIFILKLTMVMSPSGRYFSLVPMDRRWGQTFSVFFPFDFWVFASGLSSYVPLVFWWSVVLTTLIKPTRCPLKKIELSHR